MSKKIGFVRDDEAGEEIEPVIDPYPVVDPNPEPMPNPEPLPTPPTTPEQPFPAPPEPIPVYPPNVQF